MKDRSNNNTKVLFKIFLSSRCYLWKNTTKILFWSSKVCKPSRSRSHWSKVLRFLSKCISTFCVLVVCQFCSALIHKINCRNMSSDIIHYWNIMGGFCHVNQRVLKKWKPSISWAGVLKQMNGSGLDLSWEGEAVLGNLGEKFGLEFRETE